MDRLDFERAMNQLRFAYTMQPNGGWHLDMNRVPKEFRVIPPREFKNGVPVEGTTESPVDGSGVSESFIQALDEALATLRATMIDRQAKYGPGNINSMGVHGLIVRMNDKLQRILQDHQNCTFFSSSACTPSRKLPDEADVDAWIDLGCYGGIIGQMYLEGKWPKE